MVRGDQYLLIDTKTKFIETLVAKIQKKTRVKTNTKPITPETKQYSSTHKDNFFSHENHPFPLSLSSYMQLVCLPLQKSRLSDFLEQHMESTSNVRLIKYVSIMECAVLVSILKPGGCTETYFGDYTERCLFLTSKWNKIRLIKSRHIVVSVLQQQSKSTNQRKAQCRTNPTQTCGVVQSHTQERDPGKPYNVHVVL